MEFFQKWQSFARVFHYTLHMTIISGFFLSWNTKISRLFSQKKYTRSLLLSLVLLFSAIVFSFKLSSQNDILFSATPAEDIAFSLIPKADLSWAFVLLEIMLVILAFLYGIFIVPEKAPFILLAFTVFIITRAVCISLTHLGVPVDYIHPSMGTGDFFFQNDLFFSGHTGGPFLVALILWKRKFWRYFLIGISLLMAYTVLAMRLHYSIDIVGAYFITYGIFKMTENLIHKISFFIYSADKISNT